MSQEEKIEDQSLARKRPTDDGSPITVGGGGGIDDHHRGRGNLSCRFRDEDFQEEGNPEDGKHKYRHKGSGKIKTFRIKSRGVWRDYSRDLPPNGDCKIAISCRGDNDDVIINGNKFGIDMNPETYPNVGDGVHRNPNAASFITNVVFNDGQLHNLGPFDEGDDCEVCTDHVDPDRSHCPS